MVLAEKNIPYDLVEVDLKNKPKELLELNPYAKVPVLVDGAAVIYESAIINEYLEEKYHSTPLLPRDPARRAEARIWVDFCNTRIHGAAHEVMHGKEPEEGKKKLREHFSAVERAIAGRDYLVGEYSLADVTFIPVFTRQERYGIAIDGGMPQVKKWMERLLARPAVRATL